MSSDHEIPTVANLMEITVAKFFILDANDCVYEGKINDFIVNWVHPLFLKAPAEATKEDKPTETRK